MRSLSKPPFLVFKAILLLFVIHPCIANSREVSSPINSPKYIIDIDQAKRNKSIYYSAVFDRINIIRIEDNVCASIGTVSKIQIAKNKIIISDKSISKSIFTFDMKGKFLRKIGNRGNGPEDLYNPDDFTIDKEKEIIYILDNQAKKINTYNINNGKYLKRIAIKGIQIKYH